MENIPCGSMGMDDSSTVLAKNIANVIPTLHHNIKRALHLNIKVASFINTPSLE